MSTQTLSLTLPSGCLFSFTTKENAHGVGILSSETCLMIPSFTILSNSFLNESCKCTGMFLGTCFAGTVSGVN